MGNKKQDGDLFSGQHVAVRESIGRDGKKHYILYRPPDRAAVLLKLKGKNDALRRAASIESHGGDYRAAERSKWDVTTVVIPRSETALALPELPAIERIPSFDDWRAYGERLKAHGEQIGAYLKAFQLVLGDWYNFGQKQYGRRAEHAAQQLGYKPETLANFGWIANRIPASLRNENKDATLETLRAVAPLKTTEERREWLDRAKAEGWSGRKLREEIARNGAPEDASAPTDTPAQERLEGIAATGKDGLHELLDAWLAEGDELIARGDELSRAQADVLFDCAARLKEVIGG